MNASDLPGRSQPCSCSISASRYGSGQVAELLHPQQLFALVYVTGCWTRTIIIALAIQILYFRDTWAKHVSSLSQVFLETANIAIVPVENKHRFWLFESSKSVKLRLLTTK